MEEAKRVRYYPVNRDRLSIGTGIMGDGGRRNERLVFLVEEHESILYWDDHLFPVNPTHRYGEAEIRASMLYIYILYTVTRAICISRSVKSVEELEERRN